MVHEEGGETRDCELQLWLPVRVDNGGWVSAVRIDGEPGRVLFGNRESGSLLVFLDRGFPPAVLADVEAQALRMAIEMAEHLYPADMRKGRA